LQLLIFSQHRFGATTWKGTGKPASSGILLRGLQQEESKT